MSNDEGSEDRLTKGEFAELIQHLSVQEILTIEYRIGTNWNKLFARKNVSSHTFVCNLCVLETSSFKSLLSHIDGRKHRLQMDRVKQLYHPDYTYPKHSEKDIPSSKRQSVLKCNEDKQNTENKSLRKNLPITNSVTNLQSGNSSKIPSDNENQNVNIENKTVTTCKVSTENEISSTETSSQHDSDKSDHKKCDEGNVNTAQNHKEMEIYPVVTGKRPPPDDDSQEETVVKKNKIVINPANDVTKDEDKEDKPRYQSGKIIIPTVHKNKLDNDKGSSRKPSEERANNTPKFSVKSYSSKPNDNEVHGILGVEYVIKILKSRNDNSPRYECGLCELVLDGFAMQKHLEGYNHRLKFCEKHFPTAIRHYRQYMQNIPESELFKVMTPVLSKLSIAIEKHHGRNLPYECYEKDFNLNRHEILAKAFSCRHASEQYGPTFTHVVSSKEIDEFINNRNNYLPPVASRSAIFDMKPGSSICRFNSRHQNSRSSDNEFNSRHRHSGRENVLKTVDTRKSYMSSALHDEMFPSPGHYNQSGNEHIVQHVDDETYNLMVDDFLKGTLKGMSGNNKLRDHRKRSKSPSRNVISNKRKSLSPLRKNDIWQAYRHMVDQGLYNLTERFKQYRKDPETYPSYNEEWQKFWKRRKDELVSAGLDHRKYNYQPEWVRFIKIRIEELYSQEAENVKIKARERLCLPMSNENVLDEKYQIQDPKIISSNEPTIAINNCQTPIGLAVTTSSQTPSNDNIPQVVPVLRLMTALEDSLGSLGPKIIDLLSKALQAEKTNPSYVNAIILNEDNYSLIETAKEKFKGLIITGLFEGSKKRVLKQVVNDAENLLIYAYQYRQLLASQRSTIENSINQTNLLDSTVSTNITDIVHHQSIRSQTSSSKAENLLTRLDKKELASKLAASLVAQGKTDFDPQQLQQLIAVYKLIEKKKREGPTNKVDETCSSSKKTLSDTLSELLKTSNCNDSRKSKTSQSTLELSNEKCSSQEISTNSAIQQNNSRNSIEPQNFITSNSLTSVFQNSNDNYFNNTTSLMTNAYDISSRGDNLLEQCNDYGMNMSSHQQNSTFGNAYNNPYQNNNNMPQNWGWNSNIQTNETYNMGGAPYNYNPNNNWQNF